MTFVTSDQPVSEVKTFSSSNDKRNSNYSNIITLRVPIAEGESDCETPDNNDEDEDEEEEMEEKTKPEVNPFLFYSVLFYTSCWSSWCIHGYCKCWGK